MNLRWVWIASIAMSLALAGCSTTQRAGTPFQIAEPATSGEGSVYVFRPAGIPLMSRAVIEVEGETLVTLPSDGYSHFYLPEGLHTLTVVWITSEGSSESMTFPLEVSQRRPTAIRLQGVVEDANVLHTAYRVEAIKVAEVKAYAAMANCCSYIPVSP